MFFDTNRIVQHEFVPQDQTINQLLNIGVLQHLQEAVMFICPGKYYVADWLLHHHRAPAHTPISAQEHFDCGPQPL